MRSIWSINDIQKKDKREPLPEHISAAVIGGGMAGILCAWFLMESGVDTVVLEAGTVGSGQTEGTTAKITSQHGLIYSRLTETMGAEAAARYAQASQAAIDQYERIVDSAGIQCGFKRMPLLSVYRMRGWDEKAGAGAFRRCEGWYTGLYRI